MKVKSFIQAHRAAVNSVISSACLVGATAGIVFGISAGTFKVHYMNLEDADARLAASQIFGTSYYSEEIGSDWNMHAKLNSDGTITPAADMPINKDITTAEGQAWWEENHPGMQKFLFIDKNLREAYGLDKPFGTPLSPQTEADKLEKRYDYTGMIIDGASHTTMDRSFNQSLYTGLVDFNHNYSVDHVDSEVLTDHRLNIAHSHKPSQDNDTAFIDMYKAAAQAYTMIGLAGFNHASPLQKMMVNKDESGQPSKYARNPDRETNNILNSVGFVLLDSNVSNNQCVASVQFRSDQPGFLTALATCQYFFNNLYMYHNEYQPISVALFGGVQIPTVTIYMGGFQRGVEFFNNFVLLGDRSVTQQRSGILLEGAYNYFLNLEPKAGTTAWYNLQSFLDLVLYSKYENELEQLHDMPEDNPGDNFDIYLSTYLQKLYDEYSIKIIKLGDAATHFSGTFAAGDAIGITKQYLNRGASAIIAVAGPQSLDAAQEIQNQKSKCIVIGVDTAMEDGDYQRYHNGCDEHSKETPVLTDPYIDLTKAPDESRSQQSNAIIKFSAIKDIRNVTRNITLLSAMGQHWDNDAPIWEHIYEPKYDNPDEEIPPEKRKTLFLSLENAEFAESGSDAKFVKIKDTVDLEQYDSIVVPGTITFTGETFARHVAEICENSLNLTGKNISNLRNIRFDSGRLTLDTGAFNVEMTADKPHIICLDFSSLLSPGLFTVNAGAFAGTWKATDGMISLPDNMSIQDKNDIGEKIKKAGLKDWAQIAPSPTKAICGPGFQTCGNIQNGLISISWDGFFPLLQVLSHLRFNMPDKLLELPDAWKSVAEEYLKEAESSGLTIDSDYKKKVVDVENLFTFNRVEADGTTYMYDNYNHTMAILGRLLQTALFNFNSTLTLVYDENGQLQKIDNPLKLVPMSILEWLSTNMYMLS